MTDATNQGSGPPDPNTGPPASGAKADAAKQAMNVWTVLAVGLVMAALVAIVWIVSARFNKNDSATAVLGVIVPVFATVGAAVVGIPIAYKQGTSAGQQQGQAQGAQTAKAELLPKAADLQRNVDALTTQLRTAGHSPSGAQVLHLTGGLEGTGEPIELPTQVLDDLQVQARTLLHGITD